MRAILLLLTVVCAGAITSIASAADEHRVPANVQLIDRFQGAIEPGHSYEATVQMAGGGKFRLQLFPDVAPNHVANFVSLAQKKFYDGTTFHRVLEGFMAQGGDPTGTGMGGPGYTIPAEFSTLKHERGTVSMARTMDPNSAGSQFFICFAPQPRLDGQYTIFGRVVEGMEVVDKIKRRDPEMNPPDPGDAIQTVTIQDHPPTGGPSSSTPSPKKKSSPSK
ncbi:MAG: peptidylprolyl isomerase [Verrucomicrobiae bacterium]|nr:peptidylprolyl isomerase [Verrucomicrobiae bacterium]